MDVLESAHIHNLEEGYRSICDVQIIAEQRWYLVAVVGTSLSIFSLLSNVFIAIVLLRKKNSHFFFLGILAISDSFLSLMYGPVIAMDMIKDRLQIQWLTSAYWGYINILLSVCNTSMSFSTYLIALATIERFLITEKADCLRVFRGHRVALTSGALLLAFLLKGTSFLEVQLVHNGNCTGLTEYIVDVSSLTETFLYGTVYRFYMRNIGTILIPFFFLLLLNVRIVFTLRRQQRAAAMFRFATSRHKLKVRSATRLTVFIVFSYLTANFLNVIVTFWEYFNFASTQSEEGYAIYETMTDTVSVLYISACASRLLVYASSNEEIRDDMSDFLCYFCSSKNRHKNLLVSNSPTHEPAMATNSNDHPQLDSIALFAKRLILTDISIVQKKEEELEMRPLQTVQSENEEDSPVHAIVTANGYTRDTTNSDDV